MELVSSIAVLSLVSAFLVLSVRSQRKGDRDLDERITACEASLTLVSDNIEQVTAQGKGLNTRVRNLEKRNGDFVEWNKLTLEAFDKQQSQIARLQGELTHVHTEH